MQPRFEQKIFLYVLPIRCMAVFNTAMLTKLVVPTIENVYELGIWVCFKFFCFPRKTRYHNQSSECVE